MYVGTCIKYMYEVAMIGWVLAYRHPNMSLSGYPTTYLCILPGQGSQGPPPTSKEKTHITRSMRFSLSF